ncbi:MAG TPA: phenylalanine--tRNA ligase subunit alpha [Terriglobia bacterium]|nr:phenylalanine--tRNA ligase subunit alpha [Terriglobia bacterium]
MNIDEKVRQTLAELQVNDEEDVNNLFAELRTVMTRERQEGTVRRARDEADRRNRAKLLRDRWLARHHGLVAHVDANWLKKAPSQLKPVVGRQFNELRRAASALETTELVRDISLESSIDVNVQAIGSELRLKVGREAVTTAMDPTLPGHRRQLGSLHPISQVQREIEDIFLSLGFRIESGPEIESVYYNFDALNLPESHPSRDDWDTFYIDHQTVLRTHTSPVQIRAMQTHGAPLYIVIPGKCYRRDNPDSTHSPVFHQIEGLAVDVNITFADLKGTLDFFARKFFGNQTRTSFHPSFFPFTEPSGEIAISCRFCEGQGCRVCKQSGWIEVMGCGMVHPDVLRHGGVNPLRYSGWAFGLGVERYAMMKYDVNDIQLFYQNDIRFLDQF